MSGNLKVYFTIIDTFRECQNLDCSSLQKMETAFLI